MKFSTYLLGRVKIMAISLVFLFPNLAYSQADQIESQKPSLFLDCQVGCYQDYLRSNITLVDFVRDRTDADIHVIINLARTGSGGSQYTITFTGRRNFSTIHDTLTYASPQSDTQEERRAGLIRHVKAGLIPYIARTSLINFTEITLSENFGEGNESDQQDRQQEDPWNNWIFEISLSGSISGEEKRDSYQFFGGFDVSRVTDAWKIELETRYDHRRQNIELSDGRKVTSTTSNQYFNGLVVRSLNEHWSAGIISRIGSSTFQNLDLELRGTPALEYNIFPYSEYNERELYFRYELSPTYHKYSETTIFEKDEEFLLQQTLRAALNVTKTWGRVNAFLEGSHYMHDTSKNRLRFGGFMQFRVFRGLSLRMNGNYSLINDQLTLPAADITDDEALLRQRQQATSYNYFVSMGVTYTFGSIFNNIVNPRF